MKPPLVLLHAFPLDSRMWRPQVRELSDSTEVIAPDLRGFGSAHAQLGQLDEVAIDLAAADVNELLERRKIARAVIAGISRGGYIAMSFARQFPDRLAALILMDTRATPADDKEQQTHAQMLDRLPSEGMEMVADAMKERLFGPSALSKRRELVQEVNEWMMSQKADAVSAALRGMAARPDAREGLGKIQVPTLCIAGVEDGAFESTKAIAQAIPGANFVQVPEAGHLCNLERPDVVTEAIDRFLAGF